MPHPQGCKQIFLGVVVDNAKIYGKQAKERGPLNQRQKGPYNYFDPYGTRIITTPTVHRCAHTLSCRTGKPRSCPSAETFPRESPYPEHRKPAHPAQHWSGWRLPSLWSATNHHRQSVRQERFFESA